MLENFPVDRALVWIIALPLFGAIINGFFGRKADRPLVHTVAVSAVVGSFVLSLFTFLKLFVLKEEHGENVHFEVQVWEWFRLHLPTGVVGGGYTEVPINVRFTFDSLSGLMSLVVTGIGSLIHIYSMGYMSEDKSYARFFAYLNLFTASMLILILASNIPLMFVGWEGVGLCSYLLIGFWFETPAYAAAGRKAFVANRVGDFGVLIGMFILVSIAGSFEFADINAAAGQMAADYDLGGVVLGSAATIAGLFLFLGMTGKSAQIPLFVWLPDAMAGPTPVSALIHAATMVTSGVYLANRLSPVLVQSPIALSVIAIVGTLTALLAASVAMVQRDMKKILAYSTVSQLGFMFAAVGVGAFTAGFFHVFTHAFFKAALFLGAGSVMHSVHAHGDANIFKLGGLRKIMPWTHGSFLVSTIAIAGIPGLAGFFSKDEIFVGAAAVAFHAVHDVAIPAWVGWFVLIGLTIAATMTAFYMFRLYFFTFAGTYRSDPDSPDSIVHDHAGDDHDGHAHAYHPHPHESPNSMLAALVILGLGAVAGGWIGLPHALGEAFASLTGLDVHLPNWWAHWMEASVVHLHAAFGGVAGVGYTGVWVSFGLGLFAALGGTALAWLQYKDATTDEFLPKLIPAPIFRFLFDKWRVDELYAATVIGPIRKLAEFTGWIDKSFVDGVLTGLTAQVVRFGSFLFTRIQVGQLHAYGAAMAVGLGAMVYFFYAPHPHVATTVTPTEVSMNAGLGLGYEYRWDVDGDGDFDLPQHDAIVTIDFRDGTPREQHRADILRVANLLSRTMRPIEWPADRSGIGRLVDREQRTYRFELTHERVGAVESLLQRLLEAGDRSGLEGYEIEADPHSVRFGQELAVEHSFTAEEAIGVVVEITPRRGDVVELRLETGIPTRIPPSTLGGRWMVDPEGDDTPAYALLQDDGSVQIRPNAAAARFDGQIQEEPFIMDVGQLGSLGSSEIRIAPVVSATLEVRNVFGNIARETVEITLPPPPPTYQVNRGSETAANVGGQR